MASAIYKLRSVVAIICIALTGFGVGVYISSTPQPYRQSDKELNVTCLVGKLPPRGNWNAELDRIIITKNNDKVPIAVLMGFPFFATGPGSADNMEAIGYQAQDLSKSYLTLIIKKPTIENAGLYTCEVVTMDDTIWYMRKYDETNVTFAGGRNEIPIEPEPEPELRPLGASDSLIFNVDDNDTREVFSSLKTRLSKLERQHAILKNFNLDQLERIKYLKSKWNDMLESVRLAFMDSGNRHVTRKMQRVILAKRLACLQKGWKYFVDDATCIKVFEIHNGYKPQSWDSARNECLNHGADLVQIDNEDKNQFVAKLLNLAKVQSAWIGIRNGYKLRTNIFRYMNQSEVCFHPWEDYPVIRIDSEQKDLDLFCVYMLANQKLVQDNKNWKYERCNENKKRSYVCSIRSNVCLHWGWKYDEERHKCFKLFGSPDSSGIGSERRLTWTEAKKSCEHFNGHLAMPGDYKENVYVSDMATVVSAENVWIGVRNVAKKSFDFRYINGSSLGFMKPFMFTTGDNPREGCIMLRNNPASDYPANWTNNQCNNTLPYLCSSSPFYTPD